jgi:hypothetical protein
VKAKKQANQKKDSRGLHAMNTNDVTSKKRDRSGNLKEDNGEEGIHGKQACKTPPRNIKAGRVEKA